MTRRWLLSLILALLSPLAFGGAEGLERAPLAAKERAVVIVSWDGGKPSVIRQLVLKGKLPTVQGILDNGSYTFKAETIVPSSTLPSHTSMLTGLLYERHGVNWNDYRPEKGFVKVATAFELAKKAGLRTAMVFSKEKFKHLAKSGTVDKVEYIKGNAHRVADAALRLLSQVKPHLLFVHFSDPDNAGHGYGWGSEKKGEPPSPEFLEALRRCDEATGKIVAALKDDGQWQRTLLIITADHGGHDKTHGTADLEDVLIPWIAGGGLAANKGELTKPVRTMDTAATALAALGISVPEDWDGKPVREALRNGGKVAMDGKPLPILAEWKGAHSGIKQSRQQVITDAKEWERLWREVHSKVMPMPVVPKVDFGKNMVLAVFMGQKPTSGYAIRIVEVVKRNGEVIASVKETAPPKDAIVLQVLTQPFHIVLIPKVDGVVRFVAD